MTVYSSLLAEGAASSAGGVLVYTAPASGVVVVVRDVILYTGGAPPRMSLYVSQDGVTATSHIFSVVAPTQNLTYQWHGRQVLLPGEKLWFSPAGAPCDYRISGYTLT
jgi:hypothetical protein